MITTTGKLSITAALSKTRATTAQLRLYFVDTPEAESGSYVTKRVSEQAREFGIIEEESVEIGKKASAFTRAVLSRHSRLQPRGKTRWVLAFSPVSTQNPE